MLANDKANEPRSRWRTGSDEAFPAWEFFTRGRVARYCVGKEEEEYAILISLS